MSKPGLESASGQMTSVLPKKSIHNETPRRLIIKGDGNEVITLAPLERTAPLEPSILTNFNLRPLKEKNLIRVVDIENTPRLGESIHVMLASLALFIIAGLIFFRSSGKSFLHIRSTVWYWDFGLLCFSVAFLVVYLLARRMLFRTLRVIARFFWLILIAILGVTLPTAAIYFFGAGRELLARTDLQLLLLGRMLQCLFIAIAALLPALLYFLFDRQCLTTLRRRFEHSIFRLDPNLVTLTDVRAKYGALADEVFGHEDMSNGSVPLNAGSHFPILTATVLISMGWLMTFAPVGAAKCEGLLTLFVPQNSALTFGFLGAYFFSLTDILRRYVRRDLKPKAYSGVCVRIFVVVILAWVLKELATPESAVGPRWLLATAFLVGIFPEEGLTYIREAVETKVGKGFRAIKDQEASALTNLDGIDLYDRTRLMDEGVTNIESLAHYDLIDLMLETRIPVPRLIDWVDQAILYLHVKDAAEENGEGNLRERLRSYGIRTATDLLRVYDTAAVRDQDNSTAILEALGPRQDGKVNRIWVVMEALRDDEWMDFIKNWRATTIVRERRVNAQTTDMASPVAAVRSLQAVARAGSAR